MKRPNLPETVADFLGAFNAGFIAMMRVPFPDEQELEGYASALLGARRDAEIERKDGIRERRE